MTSKKEIVTRLNNLTNSKFATVVSNIKAGTFLRAESSPDYQDRMNYTRELRLFLYNPEALNIIFSDIDLKTHFLRTFGYQGQVDFTIYPNCWLRDLPLLDFGKRVYLADDILLGTNQISVDQKTIRVGKIRIGDNTIFDQRCALGYNTSVGENCIIGYQVSIGLKCKLGHNVIIESTTSINHGTRIGNNVHIKSQCQIGSFVLIDDGIVIPEFSEIPTYSHVTKEGVFNRRESLVKEEI